MSPDGTRVAFFTLPSGLKVVSLAGGPPVTLADSGIQPFGGSWGPDDFLYVVGQNGLVRLRSTGGVTEPVTMRDSAQGEDLHLWPEVLPNGKGVLFTIARGGGDVTPYDVAVVDLATGAHRVVAKGVSPRYAASGHLVYATADQTLMAAPFDQDALQVTGDAVALIEGVRPGFIGGSHFAISATGTLMYITGTEPDEMVWVARDGTAEEVDPGWTADFSSLALSPDGTQLAVSIRESNGELQQWIKQLDRGPLSKLTFEGTANFAPAWMPDGRAVAFVSNRGGSANSVYVKRADGSAVAELLLGEDRPILEAVWSLDGEWLVYAVGGGPSTDIYAIRPGRDSVPVPLVAEEGINESRARLSPDGQWLAYVSDETGQDEVYVRPFPNVDVKRQVSTNGGVEPRWAHSGRALFYRNSTNEMVEAEVTSGSTFQVGERRVLFSWGSLDNDRWDVTPDDQRFLFVRPRLTGGVIVVENWFEELKERVGN